MSAKKIGFFEGFAKAFYDFKIYPRYIYQGRLSVFLYILLLAFILSLSGLFGIYTIKSAFDGWKNDGTIPHWEFNASDKSLKTDKKFIFDDYFNNNIVLNAKESALEYYSDLVPSTQLIIVDTDMDFYVDIDEDTVTYCDPQTLVEYGNIDISGTILAFIVGRHSLIINNSGEYQEFNFGDLDDEIFSLFSYDSIMKFIDSLWIIIFAVYLIGTIISVLFGCIVQNIIASLQNNGKTSLKFGDLFKMSVHARTIPTVTALLLNLPPLSMIPLLGTVKIIVNYAIGAFFMNKAISAYKDSEDLQTVDGTNEMNNVDYSGHNSAGVNSTYTNSGDYGINTGFSTSDNNNNE